MGNREINILIAEKIMGWEVKTAMDGMTEYFDNGTLCDGKWIDDIGVLEKDNINVFKPSARIQDAWIVVEKMREGYGFWFELTTDSAFSLDYRCRFQLDGVDVEVINGNPSLAICKAALKAIESKNKN